MQKIIVKILPILVLLFLNSCQSQLVERRILKTEPTNKCDKKSKISIRTTAYTSAEKDHIKYKKLTALGTQLKKYDAASDWSKFPIGTKLKINHDVYTITDYGSAMVLSRNPIPTIDIYQPTRCAMNGWGVRNFDDVEILEMGDYQKSLNILKNRLSFRQCRIMYNRILEKM